MAIEEILDLEQLEVKGVWDWDYYERSSQRISQVKSGSQLSA